MKNKEVQSKLQMYIVFFLAYFSLIRVAFVQYWVVVNFLTEFNLLKCIPTVVDETDYLWKKSSSAPFLLPQWHLQDSTAP